MRFAVHTWLKRTPFELNQHRKLSIEVTKIIKDGKINSSDWSEISVSATNKPKILLVVYVRADQVGGVEDPHVLT